MKTLLAMRHAQSDLPSHANSDHERPLTERGTRDKERPFALFLQQHGMVPERERASSAMRARQTASRICKYLDMAADAVDLEESLYKSRLTQLIHPL